ncbi:MAG: D-alanyl-D-alanine carboxypeptidase [Candidatus Eisenbacteria bacterium]
MAGAPATRPWSPSSRLPLPGQSAPYRRRPPRRPGTSRWPRRSSSAPPPAPSQNFAPNFRRRNGNPRLDQCSARRALDRGRAAAASRSCSDSLPIGERVVVEGRLALDSDPEYEYLSVAHPEFYSASMLRAFLEEAGVHVRGGTAFHLVPKQARLLLDFPSLPLSDLVGSMNRHSNNLMADLLAMKLSSASDASWPSSAVEPPASLSAGSRALTRWMQEELGAGPDLAMRDGSGLSPRTRLSGALLSKLLVGGWNDLRIQPALVASLPAPGEDGTLRRRWKSIEPRPPVRAKTGTLGDARASAMAGYLVDPRRGTVAFVLLMNGRTAAWGIPAMQALQEKWVLTYLQ